MTPRPVVLFCFAVADMIARASCNNLGYTLAQWAPTITVRPTEVIANRLRKLFGKTIHKIFTPKT